MKKTTLFALAVSCFVFAGTALAQEEGGEEAAKEESKTEEASDEAKPAKKDAGEQLGMHKGRGYGPAGCGLGSMVFAPDSGFTQVFAATTNGTFSSQTFGITTGTSNCADSSGGEESAKAFVEANRTALAKDIARGRGETIASLSNLASCKDTQAVGRALRRNFKSIFPNAKVSSSKVSENVVNVLKSDKSLVCGNLG